jgi:hypothetical protein
VYQIEKNIPLPGPHLVRKPKQERERLKNIAMNMEVFDSVAIPNSAEATQLCAYINKFHKDGWSGVAIRRLQQDNTYRVWRWKQRNKYNNQTK